MKAFITKFVLTAGIQEVDDAEISGLSSTMISVKSLGPYANFHGEGKEWHRTREAAVLRANVMRTAKIVNLTKQIKKLEATAFI